MTPSVIIKCMSCQHDTSRMQHKHDVIVAEVVMNNAIDPQHQAAIRACGVLISCTSSQSWCHSTHCQIDNTLKWCLEDIMMIGGILMSFQLVQYHAMWHRVRSCWHNVKPDSLDTANVTGVAVFSIYQSYDTNLWWHDCMPLEMQPFDYLYRAVLKGCHNVVRLVPNKLLIFNWRLRKWLQQCVDIAYTAQSHADSCSFAARHTPVNCHIVFQEMLHPTYVMDNAFCWIGMKAWYQTEFEAEHQGRSPRSSWGLEIMPEVLQQMALCDVTAWAIYNQHTLNISSESIYSIIWHAHDCKQHLVHHSLFSPVAFWSCARAFSMTTMSWT